MTKDLKININANLDAYDLLVNETGKDAEEKVEAALVQKGYNKELATTATISAMESKQKNKHIALTKAQIVVTNTLTKAQQALNVVKKAGNILLTASITAIASYAATKIVEHIYGQITAQERLAEATKEASDEFNDTTKSINDYASKYEKLHESLIAAKGDEEETYNIKKQLFELQTELNDAYGDECGKIDIVTDAYRNQISVIKELNKVKANQFLNENAEGIDLAKDEMLQERTYQLGFGISDDTEVGKDILNIVKELGFDSINIAGLNDIEIKSNAANAEDEINTFMNKVRDLKNKYGNDPLIDEILSTSSESLNDVTEVAKVHGDTFNQALIAEIKVSDSLSAEYQEAEDAVKTYNEAVLNSSDAFNDENVDAAYQNLQNIRKELEASGAWENYSSILKEVFDGANTASYEFSKSITESNPKLDSMLNRIKGMSDLDFMAGAQVSKESIAQYEEAVQTASDDVLQELEIPVHKEAIDFVMEWAKQWDLSVAQVSQLLVNLGILQGEVLNQEVSEPKSTREMINQINSLSDGFEQLDKIMESIKDEDPFDYTLLDDKALEEFKSTGKAYDEFIETVSANPKDIKKCQDAFNNLVTEWVDGKAALDGLSDETAQLSIDMLKNMGIVNAEEVVYSRLALQKAKVAAETKTISDLTLEEIDNLAKENKITEEGTESWRAYFAQKMAESVYNGQGSILELARIIDALGIATDTWNTYWAAVRGEGAFKIDRNDYKNGGKRILVSEGTEEVYDQQTYSEAQVERNTLLPELQKAAIASARLEIAKLLDKETSGDYGGGAKTNKDGGSDKDPKKEEIDWIERKKEILQRLHDVQEEIANDENASYSDRANALDYLIEKDKERVDAAKNAVSQYEKAWLDASKNLTDEDKKFIEQGGDIVKKYNSQELFDVGIVDSLEAGEEYIDNLKSAQDWYDKMIESQKEELAHQKESIEHQKQKIQLVRDQIAAQQDLNNAMTDQVNSQKELDEAQGKYIGKAYYEDLISQSKERKSLIQEDIDRLYEQLDLTEEESAERDKILVEIENCKNELIQCEVEQAELNDTIMRLPIERLQMFRDLYAQIIEDMDNYRSIQEKMGLNPTKEELQTYIDLYAESIDSSLEQQAKLKDLLKNYSYGSDKFNETSEEIQNLDNEISNLIASQIELNNEMLKIPVLEMSEQIDKIGNVKTALQNSIAEDNAKGLQTTVSQYADLHSLTLQQLNLYARQKEELTKLLDVYDEESEYYKETEQQIFDIENEMSNLVQETYQWNQELLNIPIENLEKVNENLTNYSSILGDILSDYDSALSGVNTLIDNEIEGVQDVLDALNQQNEALQIQRNLEQSLYNLRRAEEQKNVAVIRNGEKVYESNQDDLRSAHQEFADAQYDKMVYDLEQQIEALENIKDKWQEIIDKIEEAKNLQAAEDLFGSGWQDSVLADSADLRDLFGSLYESTYNEKEAIDKQIVSNERMIQMMNELISRYRDGSITYEEALSGINSMTDSADGNYTAIEMLNGMMSLDNISGLKDISEATQVSVDETVDLLKQYMEIAESNKESVKHFETSLEGMSQNVTESVESFKKSAESLQVYIDAYKANSEAINEYTKTWDEMKRLIAEQVEALKAAAEALEKQEKTSTSSSKPSSSGSSSSSKSDSGSGVYYSAGGNSYHESTGTPAEIIGSHGTDKEKESYREYRENLIEAKREKEGEGWYEAAMKQLDEELEKAGIPKYHTGILKGPVGFTPLSNDSIYQFAKRIATNPLKADEVAAILQKGEFVTQPEQMSNIMRNNQMIGQMAAEQATNAIGRVSTNAQAFSFSIGEVHLHEVQNADEFAKALSQTFETSMQQNFSKIFKH